MRLLLFERCVLFSRLGDFERRSLAPPKISRSLALFFRCLSRFSQSHSPYCFFLFLLQWTFGLLRYDLTQQKLLDVWAYEAYRLFCDRLVNRESQMKFEVCFCLKLICFLSLASSASRSKLTPFLL